MPTPFSPLDTFDHVVVLMLENRSFDNLLGYLYQDGVPKDAPLGKTFEGVTPDLTNPSPEGPVSIAMTTDHHLPYPDPGEEFNHITTQVFGSPPGTCPHMQGFVRDYLAVLEETYKKKDWKKNVDFGHYSQIMRAFDPSAIPALTTLAKQFGVFDHWFCAVPSQTWPNRAFWHAATSWGFVNNPSKKELPAWAEGSKAPTLFNLMDDWVIYTDLTPAFTRMIHWGALKEFHGKEHFRWMDFEALFNTNFFEDCEAGNLPKYSFLEPHFINLEGWHNDMHPSSYHSLLYHETPLGSVLLGDRLVAKVYNAIKDSQCETGNNWSNTLLVITFDEHGGCFDHVSPPGATAPMLPILPPQEPFAFDRLGVRVPTIMVSAHIKPNTIVNGQMDHTSFLKTMQAKGWLPSSLGARMDASLEFTDVFTSDEVRDRTDWPDIAEHEELPAQFATAALMELPLNDLQSSYMRGLSYFLRDADAPVPETVGEGIALLAEAGGDERLG
jgi:phospholipase C